MTKFALYTKNNTESTHHVNIVDMPSQTQAEAYFAGVKNLSLTQLREIFVVKEVGLSNKTLLYGNK
tara:strand:- start:1294 stop:1491 length:198 start_codon:yes stop_codon:yes gene_type:complete